MENLLNQIETSQFLSEDEEGHINQNGVFLGWIKMDAFGRMRILFMDEGRLYQEVVDQSPYNEYFIGERSRRLRELGRQPDLNKISQADHRAARDAIENEYKQIFRQLYSKRQLFVGR